MKIFLLPLIVITLSIAIILLAPSSFPKAVGFFGIAVGVLFFIDLYLAKRDQEKDRW